MNRFVLASLLALPVLGVSQQEASAWFNLNIGVSAVFSFDCDGCHFSCGCVDPSGCFNAFGYGADPSPLAGDWAYPGTTPAAAHPPVPGREVGPKAVPAPKVVPAKPISYPQGYYYPQSSYSYPGYMPVSYYPTQGYGYYQTPAYWYGR